MEGFWTPQKPKRPKPQKVFKGKQQPTVPRIRREDRNPGTPGPTTATSDLLRSSTTASRSPRVSFGRRVRSPRTTSHDTPGPGSYRVTSAAGAQTESRKKTAPSFGFGSAGRFGQPPVTPITKPTTSRRLSPRRRPSPRRPATAAASTLRGDIWSSGVDASPGPAHYSPSPLPFSRGVSVAPVPSTRRRTPRTSTPGPGAYRTRSDFDPDAPKKGPVLPTVPVRDMIRLTQFAARNDTPAPNSYRPDLLGQYVKAKQGRHVIGTTPRFSEVFGLSPRSRA